MDTSSSPLVSIMIFHHKYSLKHLFGFIYHFTSWIIAKVTDVNYMLSKLCCLYVSILYHMVIQFLNNFLEYIFRLSPFYLPLYCGWNYYAKPPDKYQNFFRLSWKLLYCLKLYQYSKCLRDFYRPKKTFFFFKLFPKI